MKTLRTEKLILKVSGNEKPSAKLFNVVKIKLNGMKKSFVIEAVVVSQICSPITNQMVTRVSQNYPYLKNLRLADSFIVEEVKDDETFKNGHYLLHRAVITKERDTTKIRRAFDA